MDTHPDPAIVISDTCYIFLADTFLAPPVWWRAHRECCSVNIGAELLIRVRDQFSTSLSLVLLNLRSKHWADTELPRVVGGSFCHLEKRERRGRHRKRQVRAETHCMFEGCPEWGLAYVLSSQNAVDGVYTGPRPLPCGLWTLDSGLCTVVTVQRAEWAGQSTLLKKWGNQTSEQRRSQYSQRPQGPGESHPSMTVARTVGNPCDRGVLFSTVQKVYVVPGVQATMQTKTQGKMRTCGDTALVCISPHCLGFKPWYENGFYMKMGW